MSAITESEIALMKEIRADPIAKELLGAKCQWEHMSCYAVLREWGDPRMWHGGRVYKEAAAEKLSRLYAIPAQDKNLIRRKYDYLLHMHKNKEKSSCANVVVPEKIKQ